MKKILLSLFVLSLLSTTACNKDDDNNCQGVDCLPPATQTGEGTFGCLVNGEPFVDNSGFFNCFYQLVDGEYYFGIRARDNVFAIRQINIGSLNKDILINQNIQLNNFEENEFYAEISYNNQTTGAFTTENSDGFINFTQFNENSNIVSATFNFTIIDEFGSTFEITEGRFDSFFTQ